MWLPAVQTITITALTQLLCNTLPAYTVLFSLMTRKVELVFIYHTIWEQVNQEFTQVLMMVFRCLIMVVIHNIVYFAGVARLVQAFWTDQLDSFKHYAERTQKGKQI